MIFYTDLIPSRFAGFTVGPLALIRPSYKDDAGLVAHELKHVAQFWRNPFKVMLSVFVREWKLELEVEAYKEQMKHGMSIEAAANRLTELYGFDLLFEESVELLKGT